MVQPCDEIKRSDPYGPCPRSHGEQGATTLEWALMLGVIAVPSYVLISVGLRLLVDHYRMMTTLNGLPFP